MRGLGLGIGWRDELASVILRRKNLGFVEVLAESFPERRGVPLPLRELRRRGVAVVPHGVRLSLGSAERPAAARLAALASLAERTNAPLVSEHVAFVRASGREAGHLLPVPRTREALAVLIDNVRRAIAQLPVPLALEPIASLVTWPDDELEEGDFLTELVERTGALLLLDVANLYANARNHGGDPVAQLDRLPLDALAYVHVAGGIEYGGLYHDTHAHPVPDAVLGLLEELAQRRPIPAVMLERDHHHPPAVELHEELDAIAAAAGLSHRRTIIRRPGLPHVVAQGPVPRRDAVGAATNPAAAVRLQAVQAQLVAALVEEATPPPGFDGMRLAATAAVLPAKRAEGTGALGAGWQRGAARSRFGRLRALRVALRTFRVANRGSAEAGDNGDSEHGESLWELPTPDGCGRLLAPDLAQFALARGWARRVIADRDQPATNRDGR